MHGPNQAALPSGFDLRLPERYLEATIGVDSDAGIARDLSVRTEI
jgi:hypothetical protein